jgi:hypothetical protein
MILILGYGDENVAIHVGVVDIHKAAIPESETPAAFLATW